MGLRTASVRHPRAEVMAPALTETNQTQSFKLPPNQSASPVNGVGKSNDIYIVHEGVTCKTLLNGKDLNNVFDNLNTLALATELINGDTSLGSLNKASDKNSIADPNFIMNNCSPPMGDHDGKMGLQKAGLDDVSALLKDKNDADVDQLFNNFPSELPASDIGVNDIVNNVDDIMQVIKSMEGSSDRLSSGPGDLSGEPDPIFPISTSDLTGNFSNLEKELFNDVDVMNMGIEEQLIDNTTSLKETQTKDLLSEVHKKQVRLERKMDFLLRRIRKFQVRSMGQHVSSEVAGVFEHVHRTLRKCKDVNSAPQQTLIKTETISTSDSMLAPPLIPKLEESPSTQPEKLKPISYSSTKNLVKKLEMSSALQANNASRQRHGTRYFGSGSSESTSLRNNVSGVITIPQWTSDEKKEMQRVAGFLESELRFVQEELDSEATVSSSGGESCDEMQNYNNPHQQYLPIHKRAAWKYATDRAAIACRWTWLQSQVSDLEYRIRQHSDLHRKIRASKENVCLGGASPPQSVPSSPTCVNGYRGQLPGASPVKTSDSPANGTIPICPDIQCARTRPLVNFRKRKLLQFDGLHVVSKKAARPSSIRCGCVQPDSTCALCTGRTDPTHPRDISDYLSRNEKLGLLDPSYHPVFSLNEDASSMLHMEAIMKTHEWQQRSSRANLKSIKFTKTDRMDKSSAGPMDHRPRKLEHRKKYNRLKPSTANALTAKIKNRFRGRKGVRPTSSLGRLKKRSRILSQIQSLGSDGADEEVESLGISSSGKFDSPSSSPLLSAQSISGYSKRNRADSYDIDNIIIPYSVAASTRVEKLQYKEILTPKWRIAENDFVSKYDPKNNGIVKASQENSEVQQEDEDLSEESMVLRHEKSEQDEKKKFLSYLKLPIGYGRSRSNRRTDSRAESSGANTPDPMSPAPVQNSDNLDKEVGGSPLTTPPATPLPPSTPLPPLPPTTLEDNQGVPSISALRRRTVSQSRFTKDKEIPKDDRCNTPEQIEVQPYDKRAFPLNDELYEKMLKSMPDDHKLKTNVRSQDSSEVPSPPSEFEEKADFHDSESTESAFGDEDPNDPEWDVERVKERYRR